MIQSYMIGRRSQDYLHNYRDPNGRTLRRKYVRACRLAEKREFARLVADVTTPDEYILPYPYPWEQYPTAFDCDDAWEDTGDDMGEDDNPSDYPYAFTGDPYPFTGDPYFWTLPDHPQWMDY